MKITEFLQLISIVFASVFGLYQYYKQNKFIRLKNLNELWRKFYDTDEFMHLFNLMDKIDNYGNEIDITELKLTPSKIKLRYLAFLEEVAGYIEFSDEDKRKLIYLFQWQFYYLFKNKQTYLIFWDNLVEYSEVKTEEIEKTIKADYWVKMYNFSDDCYHSLKKSNTI